MFNMFHRVRAGESPATIARQYNVPMQSLLQANGHKPIKKLGAYRTWHELRANEPLRIPVGNALQAVKARAAGAVHGLGDGFLGDAAYVISSADKKGPWGFAQAQMGDGNAGYRELKRLNPSQAAGWDKGTGWYAGRTITIPSSWPAAGAVAIPSMPAPAPAPMAPAPIVMEPALPIPVATPAPAPAPVAPSGGSATYTVSSLDKKGPWGFAQTQTGDGNSGYSQLKALNSSRKAAWDKGQGWYAGLQIQIPSSWPAAQRQSAPAPSPVQPPPVMAPPPAPVVAPPPPVMAPAPAPIIVAPPPPAALPPVAVLPPPAPVVAPPAPPMPSLPTPPSAQPPVTVGPPQPIVVAPGDKKELSTGALIAGGLGIAAVVGLIAVAVSGKRGARGASGRRGKRGAARRKPAKRKGGKRKSKR